MLAPPCSDPAVFEQEKSRAGGNWEAYFAKHPDLRGIPGLRFPGPPDAPVSPAGWNCFGLFFDGVTVPSDENKLKIAENVRDWFQLLYFWIGLFPPSYPINMDLLLSFGADYAERYNKEHRVCCSEDTVIVMVSFMEARKAASGCLCDPTGFERLHYFIDACIRDTKDRPWDLPPHLHQIISSIAHQPNGNSI
ncbi:hypothetical protein LX32DRAFT_84992 [Colletotrichum zoysiae]|uniref:Uncharacterized protein n=1 Tax=Colletotrichum zoysiae TaxID=1216348 RepID=A0AAD9H9K4_9PEZI|nr:hypothetical protein LX32DRAFT_84992 [Colletotrichum zoysiae]